nr:MAG TPA: hypothetical protein [Caudoviricetes sp.]
MFIGLFPWAVRLASFSFSTPHAKSWADRPRKKILRITSNQPLKEKKRCWRKF